MIDRSAASTPTYSTQAFPTQAEHPEPPRTQQDRIKLVRGIYSNEPRLAYEPNKLEDNKYERDDG
jgi:hypothetical protein